ncbi:MAG: FAD:protein FMN transferase [Kiloniellales bacterium]
MTEARGILLPRRRFIAIAGVAAGCAAMGPAAPAAAPIHRWHGTALGSSASIQLLHPEPEAARVLIEQAVAEMARLERIFSLYRSESDLSRLNRGGMIEAPPLALVELLARAAEVSRVTDGVFDVTIQPLWRRFAVHFSRDEAAPSGPVIDDVLPLVDWRALDITPERIAFRQPGMAVTLNGIAQGFVTDRVAELFGRNGVDHVLLDLGEIRACGQAPAGRPWRVGIADPLQPAEIIGRLDLASRAVATSGGYGTLFDASGRFSHLIDPRSGRTAPAARSVTVTAADATTADAYSTAFALMDEPAIAAVARGFPDLTVHVACGAGLKQLSA